jgi:hypothetical protein
MADHRRTTAERRDSKPVRLPEAGSGTVRVWLLGRSEVSIGSRIIRENEWRLRKAASLVKLLALAPGHYEQLREVLQRELGTEPEEATRRVYQEILAGHVPIGESFPGGVERTEPSDTGRHNLPGSLTSFVGREREKEEVKRTRARRLSSPPGRYSGTRSPTWVRRTPTATST